MFVFGCGICGVFRMIDMKDDGLRDYEKLVTPLLSPTTGLYRNQLMHGSRVIQLS